MTTIYVYRGEYGHGEKAYGLIKDCAARFRAGNGLSPADCEIRVSENGKPFFVEAGSPAEHLEFSVSNSGDVWVCAVSTVPCGVDVQKIADNRWELIAERRYKQGERLYAERIGEQGFYRVWTRKEALAKLTGRGLFGGIPAVADRYGSLLESVEADGRTAYFSEPDIGMGSEFLCALCTYETGPARVVRCGI